MKTQRFFFLLLGVLLIAAPLMAEVQEIPVTTNSKQAKQIFMKAQRLLDIGRPQEANALFENAVQKDSTFSYGYLNIANSAASTEEFKKNLDLAMKHIDGKSEGEKLLIQINQTFLDNNADRRIELSKTLVEKYPNSPRAWLTLSFAQGSLNNNEAARQSVSKALKLDPKFLAGHYALTVSYLFSNPKDFEKARQSAETCTKLEPNEAKGYEGLGDVYRALNHLEKARDAYSMAVKKDPTLSVASLKKGHINSFLGNYEEARADYDKGVAGAKDANRIFYANYRAFTNLHEGKPKAAIVELGKLYNSAGSMGIPADEISGAKIFTLTNELTIALHHNLIDSAEKIMTQLKEATSEMTSRVNDPNVTRLQKANLLQLESQLAARKGDFKTAMAKAEENKKLIESDTNPRRFEAYHGAVGLIYLLQDNYQKAIEHYNKANLTVMYVKYQLGLALEGAGQKDKAKAIFKEVAGWNFNSVGYALVRKDAMARST